MGYDCIQAFWSSRQHLRITEFIDTRIPKDAKEELRTGEAIATWSLIALDFQIDY